MEKETEQSEENEKETLSKEFAKTIFINNKEKLCIGRSSAILAI